MNKPPRPPTGPDIAASVAESAQQIWLAGLGAFAKTQQQGGKVFEALVKEGAEWQQRTQAAAEQQVGHLAGRLEGLAGGLGLPTATPWERLEGIFEQRVAQALARLGVPSAAELQALAARVDALARSVDELSRSTRGPERRKPPKDNEHPQAPPSPRPRGREQD